MLQTEAYFYDRKLRLQTFIVRATEVALDMLLRWWAATSATLNTAFSYESFLFCQLQPLLTQLSRF
jgi:hypothetical protein